MSGYTPVFRTIFEGSLCGQWPYTAGWLIFLSLADKHGHVDMTPQFISAITGMPLEDLQRCIDRFVQPDPASRTPDEDGRRLVALDPSRPWGWRIVNHAKYREKARKSVYDERRTATGEDAERKKDERSKSVPTRPDASRALPLSDTNTNADTKAIKNPPNPPSGGRVHVFGLNLEAWTRWEQYRRDIRKPLKPASIQAAQKELAACGENQLAMVEQSIAQGWTGIHPLRAKAKQQQTTAVKDPYARAL